MQCRLVLAFLCVSSLPVEAQAFRLSGRLNEVLPLPVWSAELAGARVVFEPDQPSTPVPATLLYSVPVDGSEAPLPLFSNASTSWYLWTAGPYVVSPDGTRVVLRRDHASSGPFDPATYEIVASPVAVFAPVSLVGNLPNTVAFEVSPDSERVVYFGSSGAFWSVPIDGSGPIVTLSSSHFGHRYSVDGSRIAYLRSFPYVLVSRPVDGSAPETVLASVSSSPATPALSEVSAGGRIAYGANGNLSSVPIDGSAAPILLSTTHPGRVLLNGSPLVLAGERVLYHADPAASGERRLFSVPLDGSAAPVELGRRLPAAAEPLDLTPDRMRVLFRSDVNAPGVFELFVAPVDGSAAALRLATASGRALVSADGTRAVFDAVGFHPTVFDSLNVVSLDASAGAIPLVPPSAHPVGFQSLRFTPDGTRVLYVADDVTDGREEPSIVALDASAPPVRLGGGAAGDVAASAWVALAGESMVIAPTIQRSVYTRPLDASAPLLDLAEDLGTPRTISTTELETRGPWTAYVDERMVVHSATIGERHRLSPPGSSLVNAQVAPGFSHVVYNDLHGGRLLSVPIRGGVTIQLSPSTHTTYGPYLFEGLDTLFMGYASFTSRTLFRVPTNGSAPAVALHTVPSATSALLGTSPDGRHALVFHTRSVDRVDLSGALATTTLATDYRVEIGPAARFTLDSTRFVYRSSAATSELRSVLLDGSASPITLAGGGNRHVLSFALSPDTLRAAFVYLDSNNLQGTGFAPTDGSSAEVVFPPVASELESIGVGADGSGLLYVREGIAGDSIYFQPLLAGAPATPLAGPFSSVLATHYGGGSHVVVEVLHSGSRLLALPSDGSGGPIVLQLGQDAGVMLSPDGTRVAFVLGGDLYWCPVDGSQPARLVNRGGLANASFEDVAFTLGSKAVTFRATLQEPDVFDVYGAFLDPVDHVRKPE